MCNLYNVTTNQEAIRANARTMSDLMGNMEPSLNVHPDYPAPIVRNNDDVRELAAVRWGLPCSQFALMQAAKKRAAKREEKGKAGRVCRAAED
ncbi:hypothetical protein RHI9324_04851 [Rhizobium sp. CECT 9324]|nr:hypothetical protein RHI9324_04851 [Rhizobium sp. CECT 9324]